jgi:hypothetical protein
MSNKELVIESVRRLPEDVSLQEIAEEIEILTRLRVAEQAAAAGRVQPQARVRELVRQWTTK